MVITKVGTPTLPDRWEGEVHSVFSNSCNLRLHQGPLVCLHRFSFGMLPHSLYVPDLDTQGMAPGQPVHASPSGLVIDHACSIPWSEHLEVVETRIQPAPLPTVWQEEWEVLHQIEIQQQQYQGVLLQVYQTLTQQLSQVLQALFSGQTDALTHACNACLGLGQGLTPSGDDMLLGVLAALHRYAPQWVPPLKQSLAPLLGRTNEISAGYLDWAMEGYVSTPVLDVLHHLGQNWEEPRKVLLSVGHSSGSDILYGTLTAVKK